MNEEIQDTSITSELSPVLPSDPQPLKFVIFETIVYGNQVFHPGQEQALVDAALPITTIRQLCEGGAIRGQYPNMPQFEKNPNSFTQFKTGN